MRKITTLGGGTGQYELLRSLAGYEDLVLRAIVTMADDGGSSGELRTQLGVLPAGDLRQCLVALARIEETKAIELMNFRFSDGVYSGDNMGNLIFAACEKLWGLEEGLRFLSQLLDVRGEIIPVTFEDVTLVAKMKTGQIIRGEDRIGSSDLHRLERLLLEPEGIAVNRRALDVITESDAIIIGPGDLHTSIIPNLLVPGITRALVDTRARLIYVCNLMTKPGQTDGLTVKSFTETVEQYIGRKFDEIVYNTSVPDPRLLKAYHQEGECLVEVDENLDERFIGTELINGSHPEMVVGDTLSRTLVRHDRGALAKTLRRIVHAS